MADAQLGQGPGPPGGGGAEAESGVGAGGLQRPPPATTTISTISLQSGATRLVIALLQSRDWLHLKVLELTPELTQLGASLADALALQRQHEEVLIQLQNKQSPVEELLRQADQLIASQRPRAEVYAAMAESLGLAWKDVNSRLEQRKLILDLNVAYQSRAEECIERMKALEMACSDANVPVEIEAVKKLVARLHDLKRLMLEALMVTLQDGKALHEKLKEVAAQGSLDSRPDRIRTSASYSVSQIEHWLENLHDRRKVLEVTWQSRKTQLEQCLALSLLAKDLKDLEEFLSVRKESLQRSNDQLGDSASSAELLLHENKKLLPEAREFQDRCLKVIKATEKLVSSGHFAADQAIAQAYIVLNSCAEYLDFLEQRESLLSRAISFFRSSHTALTKLDQLEVQLTTTDLSLSNPYLAQLHLQATKALEEITSAPLQEGYALLETVGRSAPGAEGVKRTVEVIENRKISLDNLCTAHKEENIHLSRELTTFLERQNELYSWLVSIAEAFLQGHQDMGSVLAMAEDFLQLHNQLLNDLQNKGGEINEVLLTLPPILERLNDEQRTDIDEKVDALHSHWLNLKSILEARIDLATLYVKFHSLAVELANEFDTIEEEFKRNPDAVDEDIIRQVEQKWLHIQQLYEQLKSFGKSFVAESNKVVDPYLDTKRASLCVETLLDHFGSRQLLITESWQMWQTSITVEREFKVLWERNMSESNRTISWVTKFDTQLYPVLTCESSTSKTIVRELEEKIQVVLPELKKAQAEIELRVKTAESLASKGDSHGQKEAVINKLMEQHNKLNNVTTEYQILLQMLISFFKNLSELEKTIENLQSQYHVTRLPNASAEVDLLIKEHEASRQAVLELFRFTQNESEQIICRINKQEPEKAARHDIERVTRLLEIKKLAWESAWTDRKLLLDQHHQLCQFDTDLQQINTTLADLTKQLSAIKGQYGESLASAKATSTAFVYFEKTIQLLETRIETFVSTAEHMLKSDHASSHVERELNQLQARWSAFRNQVLESRRLIDLSIEYFTLVEEAEEWFREGSKLLVTIARKSTTVRLPEEASHLLNEVEIFLKPGEVRQDERIKKISKLAVELYGEERSKQFTLVVNENKEMLDSFTIISEELSTLARNLKAADEQKERQKKEQEEADASLAAAKAEAVAARAAAAAAEEARRAAESAAKALQETVPVIERVEIEAIPIPPSVSDETTQTPKTPSPPPKKPKVVEEIPKPIAPIFTVPLHDVVIQEGEQFTFECRVTGFPVPEVIWYKDGISIQNNPDYQTLFDQGICTLKIEETFTEDSARFTCRAANSAGTAETNATLSVKEAEPEEQLMPPNFTKRLESGTAKEGSSFHFDCTVEGNPLPTVQWYKNETCIDNSPDYVITYNNGEAILKFEEVFLEDQADYICKASNPLGTDTCSAKLSVEPLEPTEAPSFVTPLSNVMARAGRKIKLECEVTGLPTPELTWSHNGKIIKETRDTKIQYESDKAILVINEAFPKDAGTYIVGAKNIAGEATCTCNVSVKGRLPTETSDSELASDIEPIKPSIHLALKDVSIFEGKKVRLDCIIVGQPEPEVIWYHDDRPVKESSDFQLLFQGDRCSLIIQEAYLEDAGEYKVVAINSGGEASSKCNLSVKSMGENEPAARPQIGEIFEMPLGSPPKFNKLLSDVLAAEGDTVVLECTVVGDPKPDIKWYLNNQEIVDVHMKQYNEDAEGNVSLTLMEVTPQNKGVYTVKATNSYGEAKFFANLIVKARENQPRIHMEDKQVPPTFKELFADRTVPEDTTTKFECVVTGKPSPRIQWCFNDEPISGKDFIISSSGGKEILTIQKVKTTHSGRISCIAENDVGKSTCVCKLSVTEPQTIMDIEPVLESSAISEKSESSFIMKRSVYMQSSSQMTSTTMGGAEPNIQSHSISSQAQQTYQQIGQKPPVQVQSQKIQEIHQINNEKPDVRQQSFLKISNGGDDTQESSASNYSTPVSSPRPLRKSIAPRFISPLNGKIVDQGADVTLEGIIDGYPQPTVTWTKNGQELKPVGSCVSITHELNRVEVILKNVTVKDGGRYTCKAVNNVGSASSTADVVVKKTIFPPVFGRRLQAQAVKEGERVVMEVEITGTPEPTVIWYKDGQQLPGNIPACSYRTKVQGNCYSLIIERASLDYSGEYSVKAVNSGGEAQNIANFIVYKPEPEIESTKQIFFEDIIESKTETHSRPQTPAANKVTRVTSPLLPTTQTMPSSVSSAIQPLSSLVESSITSESRIVTETTKTEKLMSIRVERTPSPTPFKISPFPETAKETLIHTEVEERKPSPAPSPTPEKKVEIEIPIQVEEREKAPSRGTTKESVIPIQVETDKSELGHTQKIDDKLQTMSSLQEFRKEILIDVQGKTQEKVLESLEIQKEQEIPITVETDQPLPPLPDPEPPKCTPAPIMEEPSGSEMQNKVATETTSEGVTESGVETTSLSKRTAFEFFVNKLKEGEGENLKPPKEPIQLPKEKVNIHTFISSSLPQQDEQSFTKTEIRTSFPTPETQSSVFESVTSQFHSEHTSSMKFEKQIIHYQPQLSADSLLEEFHLTPEPPPEMGFIPKSEAVTGKYRDDVTTRVKKLEEAHRVLSPTEIPSGAVRIFPAPLHSESQIEETFKTSFQKPASPASLSTTQKIPRPVLEETFKKEVAEEVCVQKRVTFPGIEDWSVRPMKLIQEETTPKAKSWATPELVGETKRPESPKPVEMKPWTPSLPLEPAEAELAKPTVSAPAPAVVPFSVPVPVPVPAPAPVSTSVPTPTPFVCTLPEPQTIPRPSSPRPSGLSIEKEWVPSIPKSELEIQTSSYSIQQISEIVRSASPRPSAEGLAMEKLWTPQKPPEPESIIPMPSPVGPRHFERDVSPKPSVEGLAMDKLWAHKHPDAVLKKVWPPPQPTEEKPVIPWTTKTATEKVWPPAELSSIKEISPSTIEHDTVKLDTCLQKSSVIEKSDESINKSSEIKSTVISQPSESFVPHYVSETRVTHSSALVESEVMEVTTMTKEISELKEERMEKSVKHLEALETKSASPPIVEESILKPSEAKKFWPPPGRDTSEVKYVAPVRDIPVRKETVVPPTSQALMQTEVPLEPGPPPEIGFAHPPVERKQSYVETIEQDLEKDLEKEPSRHLVGAVRTIPPPPTKEKMVPPPPLPQPKESISAGVTIKKETEKSKHTIQTRPFEPFPELEPFPFKPDSPKGRPARCPPPPKPSKFIRGEFVESDYESDWESVHILPKWRPYESDTEEISYRRVRPPTFIQPKRPKSTEPEPLPPSRFEKPLQLDGPPRPVIDKTVIGTKEAKIISKNTSISLETKSQCQTKSVEAKFDKVKKTQPTESRKKHSPPLKPGSPPQYIQPIQVSNAPESVPEPRKTEASSPPTKIKPDSPKSKSKTFRNELPESGYMADTDEPRYSAYKSTNIKHEESLKTAVEKTTVVTEKFSQQMTQLSQQQVHIPSPVTTVPQLQQEPQVPQQQNRMQHHIQHRASAFEKPAPTKSQSSKTYHRHSESKSEKKVVMSSSGSSVKSKKDIVPAPSKHIAATFLKEERESSLEPFPFTPDPPCPIVKRTLIPPPPSPSKFVKGEFRESDYESDIESRIPVKWKPTESDAEEPLYRPVRPVLTPSQKMPSKLSGDRTPTPPTEFDNPPQFGGPPRPKFEPIEKLAPSPKLEKIVKPTVQKQKVFKPKPVTPRAVPSMEIVKATPIVKPMEPIVLEPGSPPEIGYAPPPQRTKVKVTPFENATQIETSQVMNFAESTEHSHRVVNVQQTTRVIKFGEEKQKGPEPVLEPFPFTPEPQRVRRKSGGPPPTMPKKFIPGDFRESDYESDIEAVRIKPKWAPGDSDTDEPHYRRVRPPQVKRSSSVPTPSVPVSTPMEFDTHRPQLLGPVSSAPTTPTTTITTHVITTQQHEAEQRRQCRVEEMRRKFDETAKSELSRSSLPVARPQEVSLKPGEPPEFGFSDGRIPNSASYVASRHMSEMTNTFKSKAQQFVSDIITDVNSVRQTKPDKPILKPSVDVTDSTSKQDPQAYREESRLAEYGTKHIDPDTGLIYFKYDFGYEFGIVLPGEGKRQVEGIPAEKLKITQSRRSGDIEVPVIHEKTEPKGTAGANKVPQFRPKKFTHFKSVKWEPASESEMSEAEGDLAQHKKRYSLPQPCPAAQKEPHIHIPATSRWEQASPSPLSVSLSPSLPSLSPHSHGATLDSAVSPGDSWQGLSPSKSPRIGHGRGTTPTPPSTPSTPGSTPAPVPHQLRRPPIFITPLRDIAVVSGQTARFECIVQAEPPPNILWAKNGRIIESSQDHQIQYRNGVCRLTLPKAFPEDAGTYTCTATNMLGTVGTSGSLQVPGLLTHMHGTYEEMPRTSESPSDWEATISSLMTDVAGIEIMCKYPITDS